MKVFIESQYGYYTLYLSTWKNDHYIRIQCKLEKKPSNNDKIIIKTRCYFEVNIP